jgi:hypothetical protein
MLDPSRNRVSVASGARIITIRVSSVPYLLSFSAIEFIVVSPYELILSEFFEKDDE